jgi:hypothetical protein
MNALRFLCSLFLLTAAMPPATVLAADTATAGPANQADGQQALGVLNQLLSFYMEGQFKQAEALLEPQMVGYSRVMDALRETGLTQKQLRINLSDTRTLVSPDVVIIRCRWEKRFLTLPGLAPARRSGNATFVMHREAGVWRLSALSGDNLFSVD